MPFKILLIAVVSSVEAHPAELGGRNSSWRSGAGHSANQRVTLSVTAMGEAAALHPQLHIPELRLDS